MAEKRARMKYPAPVAALIASVFAGKPVQKILRELKVWQVWEESVGQQIAAKAKPAGIRDGVLIVKVASSAWMQQLSLMKPDIIRQLNIMAGEPVVKDIIFKSGSVAPLAKGDSAPGQKTRKLSNEEELWIREQSAIIDDPELRQVFSSLLSRHLTSNTGST
jgi:hypothetical protein